MSSLFGACYDWKEDFKLIIKKNHSFITLSDHEWLWYGWWWFHFKAIKIQVDFCFVFKNYLWKTKTLSRYPHPTVLIEKTTDYLYNMRLDKPTIENIFQIGRTNSQKSPQIRP